MEHEVYYNEDKTAYAVLVSPGYGSGWSTWYYGEEGPALAYDKNVVEFWLAHHEDEDFVTKLCSYFGARDEEFVDEIREYFSTLGFHENVCFLGFSDIKLQWVPCGSIWRIVEYDGAEHIEFIEDCGWQCPA